MKTFKLLNIFLDILLFNIVITSCTKDVVAPTQQVPVYIPSTPDSSVYSSIEYLKTDSSSDYNNWEAAASAGNKILFAGDGKANIYDIVTGQWTSSQLSQLRVGISVASAGNKILIAGGNTVNGISDVVDIYDVTTGQWAINHLSQPRFLMAATSTGNLIFFAGGIDNVGISKIVDIYDITTGTWTTNQLRVPRQFLSAAAAGNKVLFAGGLVPGGNISVGDSSWTNIVDVYDAVSGKWTTSNLNRGRAYIAGASSGNKIIFAGGDAYSIPVNEVDIFDIISGNWTIKGMDNPKIYNNAASSGNLVFFTYGMFSENFNIFDMYNTLTGQWSTYQLSKIDISYGYSIVVSARNKVLFTREPGKVEIFVLK